MGMIRVVRTSCEGGDMGTGGDAMAPADMPEEVVEATPEATPEEVPADGAEAPAAGDEPAAEEMPAGGMPAAGVVPCSQTCFYEVVAEMEWTADRCGARPVDV